MKRKKRTEILINGSLELSSSMAQEVSDRYSVTTIEEPNQGLIMVKMRESAQNSLFYLGEVLVTECRVQIEDKIGLGIVKGIEPELSYQLAVIDAAYEANLPETNEWATKLQAEEEKLVRARKANAAKVLRTKVNFETMVTDQD
ncbi:phosphonate C-P lyase system protein PhnG [Bacillaceae bacterium SIJ1]|uniref:phosphonate C-P lyase system protein PhnG n=1 Tax=Litoribacterium kuwaitense TaxID=1398745 RepID=UPI0013ECBA20|nr:phosphonate C-P lyase system protein PhnG [Litoribacterium kuwaitense]NGP45090.1 phosphonate C-P lyase system protein PhnG [Litoribacterium kuwaitense]